MKVKAKDIERGDVVEDTVLPEPTRVAEIDHLKSGTVMIRYACRKTWHAYTGGLELEVR